MIIKPIGYSSIEMLTGGSASRVKTGSDSRFAPNRGEHASLSSDTAAVNSLVTTALQPSGARLAKLESIKASIRDGSYQIDAAQTATAILADQA